MTRPEQDEYPFGPGHMTSDTYDHSDSNYFRDYHYMYGNQFTPHRLQQRSFHRRNQNQQPSQHRPQYSPYTNTGIDQEHDRSSTNLTSTDRILAMLRIKREARLKLRDQSNQDDHRLGSAAQEPAPQPSQEPETGTHTPAEPVPSEKAGAPSQDPQGLHSESVTIKSKPTVPRPNQVDCSDPEPTPDSELTIGTIASAGTSNTGIIMPTTRALPVPVHNQPSVQSESSVQSEPSVQPSPSIKPTTTPTLPTAAAGLEMVMNGTTKASQDGANPQVKSKHESKHEPDPTLALPPDPDKPANFYDLPSLTKPPQAPPTPTESPVPPKPPEPSAQPAPPAPPALPVPTRGTTLGSSKVLGQDVDGDNEVVGASAVDRSRAVDGNRNVEIITAVNGDKDVDSGTAATDEQHVVIPISTYTEQLHTLLLSLDTSDDDCKAEIDPKPPEKAEDATNPRVLDATETKAETLVYPNTADICTKSEPLVYDCSKLPDWSMKIDQDKKDTVKSQMEAQVQAFFWTSPYSTQVPDRPGHFSINHGHFESDFAAGTSSYGSASAPDYNSVTYDMINSDQEFKDFQSKRQNHEVIIQPEIPSTASQAFRAYDSSLNNYSYSTSKGQSFHCRDTGNDTYITGYSSDQTDPDPAKEFKIAEHVFKDDDNKDDDACTISCSDDDRIHTINLYTDVFTYDQIDSGPKFYGVQINFQDHCTMTTTGADFLTDHAVHQQTGVT